MLYLVFSIEDSGSEAFSEYELLEKIFSTRRNAEEYIKDIFNDVTSYEIQEWAIEK